MEMAVIDNMHDKKTGVMGLSALWHACKYFLVLNSDITFKFRCKEKSSLTYLIFQTCISQIVIDSCLSLEQVFTLFPFVVIIFPIL